MVVAGAYSKFPATIVPYLQRAVRDPVDADHLAYHNKLPRSAYDGFPVVQIR